jgi:RNA polymerase sigma-70 factor (ECF subfamily)
MLRPDAAGDTVAVYPGRVQLGKGDHAVLAGGDSCHSCIRGAPDAFLSHFDEKSVEDVRFSPEIRADSLAAVEPGTSDGGDADLVESLRRGDEATFARLVDELSPALLRVAQMHVPSRAVAEEVVQETWLGVLKGIDSFEGRSSLKTWIFRILLNTAKTKGERERRTVPFSIIRRRREEGRDEPAVDPDRFQGRRGEQPGAWSRPPQEWSPDEKLESDATRRVLLDAIAALPIRQREVITLRDINGWSAEEARNALDVSETNQRVLLHRARSKVRGALERHFDSEGGS